MTTNTLKIPDIVQACDYWEDREYYKKDSGFLFSSVEKIRSDRIKNWKQWDIVCTEMPDVILVNGKNYKLVEIEQ